MRRRRYWRTRLGTYSRIVGNAEVIVEPRPQEDVITAAKAGSPEADICFDSALTRLVRAIRKYCHIVPGAFTPVLAKSNRSS